MSEQTLLEPAWQSGEVEVDDEHRTGPGEPRGYLALARESLLLGREPYADVAFNLSPVKRGFIFLLIVLGIVAAAYVIRLVLGTLTSTNYNSLQARLLEGITGLQGFKALDTASAAQFQTTYGLAWDGFRAVQGIPTIPTTLASIVSLAVIVVIAWLLFSLVATWLARWFGSRVPYSRMLGAVAVAFSPLLLLAFTAIPGAVVPVSLILLALVITQYLGVKTATVLPMGKSLATVLGAHGIVILAVLTIALLGAAFGLSNLPFADAALRNLSLLR